MVSVFDDVLEVLKDGKYHSFEELWEKVKTLNENQLELILGFLLEYDLIKRQRKTWSLRTRQAKLNPILENFLKRLAELETLSKTEAAMEGSQG